jgi:hypothetical protein
LARWEEFERGRGGLERGKREGLWLKTTDGWFQELETLGCGEIEMVGDEDDELLWW